MSDGDVVRAHPSEMMGPASDAGEILRYALDKGVDVDGLEKLQGMYERSQDRQAVADFNAALARFQTECPVLRRDSQASIGSRNGQDYGYSYASLDSIASQIRPYLKAHGLAYSWDSDEDGDKLVVTCTVRHIGGHAVSSKVAMPMDSRAGMSSQQKAGSAMTYARRYSLTAALGLTTGEPDDDGAGGPATSAEPMSDAQLAEVLAIINKIGDAFDEPKFLGWIGSASLDEIPASQHARVMHALKAKLAEADAKAEETMP